MNTKEAIVNVGRIIDLWAPIKGLSDHVPGIAIGIVAGNELVYAKGFGESNVATQEPVTIDTNFQIASLSKTFTAVAIMQLVEQGVLDIDTPAGVHIPWLASYPSCTIRSLLMHASGICRDGSVSHWDNGTFPTDLASEFKEVDLFPSVGDFKYSNFGYAVLGEIVTRVSGIPYKEYIQNNVFTPLNMKNTVADYDETVRSMALGYRRIIPGQERDTQEPYRMNAYAPAAGSVSNIRDMGQYMSALIACKDPITIAMRQQLWEPRRDTENKNKYGFGFDILKTDTLNLVGHGGGSPGFISQFMIDPAIEVGGIILGNASPLNASAWVQGIFELIHDAMKQPNVSIGLREEGLYRCRRYDRVVCALGEKLLMFSPSVAQPLAGTAGTVLCATEIPSRYKMSGGSKFGMFDESAEFSELTESHYTTLREGPDVLKRISIKTNKSTEIFN